MEVVNRMEEEVKIKILECVPYQLCPKCNGQGQVSIPSNVAGDRAHWVSASVVFPCDVCNGNKIIPMYVINNNIE